MMTFTRESVTFDEATGQTVKTSSSISGTAVVKSSGDPTRYEQLKLKFSQAPTILFTPVGYPLRAYTPEFVLPGDTCLLNGVRMTVRDVAPVAPDGFVVIANIIVSV